MTLSEQIKNEAIHEFDDTVPCIYHITKRAESSLYFFSEQMDCEEDEALEILLRYLSLTDVCIPVLEHLGYKFDPNKSF